jgi:hypothetical protein
VEEESHFHEADLVVALGEHRFDEEDPAVWEELHFGVEDPAVWEELRFGVEGLVVLEDLAV